MTQQRAILTRASLITSAACEFAEHSYASASVNTILATAGCTKGAMYFHFKSKAELADAVLDEARTIYSRIVEPWLVHPAIGIDLDPLDAVRAMTLAVGDATHTHTELRAETRLTLEPHYLADRPSLVWENAIGELFTRAAKANLLGNDLSPQRATHTLSTLIAGQRYMNTMIAAARPSDPAIEGFSDIVDVVLAAAVGHSASEHTGRVGGRS